METKRNGERERDYSVKKDFWNHQKQLCITRNYNILHVFPFITIQKAAMHSYKLDVFNYITEWILKYTLLTMKIIY